MEVLQKTDGMQLIHKVVQGPDVLGYVVIDSTIGGRSCGGLRMLPDIDEAEMRALARSMTLKYGFLGLPQGGAKAGVRGNPDAPTADRRQRLILFARAIAPLLFNGSYFPSTDMGTESADIRYMIEAIGMRLKRRVLLGTQSGYYTALTVLTGAKQATNHLGLSLSECRVAIEGFGSVGSALGELLASANVCVAAVSTSEGAIYNPNGLDMKRLKELAVNSGSHLVDFYSDAERIERATLLELPVDLLCPCARHNSLTVENAPRIEAKIICPGANNPVTPEAERILFERGVLCLPDFVTNSGGVLGGTMEFAAVDRERIEEFIMQHIGRRVAWLLDEASQQRLLPREIATPFAMSRFSRMQRNADKPSMSSRTFALGLELYRRGWLPRSFSAILSPCFFKKRLD